MFSAVSALLFIIENYWKQPDVHHHETRLVNGILHGSYDEQITATQL